VVRSPVTLRPADAIIAGQLPLRAIRTPTQTLDLSGPSPAPTARPRTTPEGTLAREAVFGRDGREMRYTEARYERTNASRAGRHPGAE